MNARTLWLAVTVALLLPGSALAADASAIMKEAFKEGDAKSTIATMEMILKSASGSENKRLLKMEQVGSEKQLMWFKSPNDLRGTAFLQIKEGDDERMWLYMPSLKMTNRISGKRKQDSFMGSEFTYEDMATRELEDYEFKYLKEDMLDGKKVHVIEGRHVDPDSGYSKTVFYVDDAHKEIQKADMYSKSEELIKVSHTKEIKVIDGKRIPTHMVMENVQDNDSTIIHLKDVELDVSIPDNHFSERYMPRVR